MKTRVEPTVASRAALLTALLLGGCEEHGLHVTLRLTDPIFVATSSARLIVSSTDGTSFPPKPMGVAMTRGLVVSNEDVDGDGAVDAVLDLQPDFAFSKANHLLITPVGVSRAVNVALRAEVFDALGNRLAKLGGPSRKRSDESVLAILDPASATHVDDLVPACVSTCPDATEALATGDANGMLEWNGDITAVAVGRIVAPDSRARDLVVAGAHDSRPAPAEGVASPNAGQVVVYRGGGSDFSPLPPLFGASAGDQLGAGLAVGDLDGDGFDDLLLGAPGQAGSSGALYVVYGASSFAPPDLRSASGASWGVVVGAQPGDRLGAVLALIDDADGQRALLVAAPGASPPSLYLLRAADVPRGAPGPLPAPALTGPIGSGFGASLATSADLVAVGAPLYQRAGQSVGAVFLYDRELTSGAPFIGDGGGFGTRVALLSIGGTPWLAASAPAGPGSIDFVPSVTVPADERSLPDETHLLRGAWPGFGATIAVAPRPLSDALLVGVPDGTGHALLLRGETLAASSSLRLDDAGRPAAVALAGARDGDGLGRVAAVADLDGDGHLELAVATSSHTLAWFQGVVP
jgi:hypothetical protein